MTTRKLYTATIDGEVRVGLLIEGKFWYLDDLEGRSSRGSLYFTFNYTDLTPVTVVPKDAVVIDIRNAGGWENLSRALHSAYVTAPLVHHHSISSLIHRLTPSATTESEGGAGEDQPLKDVWACKNCDIKFFTVRTAAEHVCNPTVTIELTFEEAKELVAYSKGTIIRDKIISRVYEKANQLVASLTPPRPEEPPYRSVVITPQGMDIPDLNHQSVPWAYQRTIDGEDGDLSWQMIATSDEWYSWKQICEGAEIIYSPVSEGQVG